MPNLLKIAGVFLVLFTVVQPIGPERGTGATLILLGILGFIASRIVRAIR